MFKRIFVTCASLLLISASAHVSARTERTAGLERQLQQIIAPFNGIVGIAVADLDGTGMVTVNDRHRYPMQSVFKFPLAICILDMVDRHTLALDSVIHIKRGQLRKNTFSPLADEHPDGNVDITISRLLYYAVSLSDNNACDILFQVAGGVHKVDNYIHSKGVKDIAIAATENEMHAGWQVQYTNWCRPSAMQQLLRLFYEQKLLSKPGNDLLMKLMTESKNSAGRIKGLLPEDAVVAHKTGSSGANSKGLIAATNDVGIMTARGGHHIAIVVYVSDYRGTMAEGEKVIAKVARCVWDYYTYTK